jgi:hypothetical protein
MRKKKKVTKQLKYLQENLKHFNEHAPHCRSAIEDIKLEIEVLKWVLKK